MTDADAARKPDPVTRPSRRLWLLAPVVLLAVAAIGWSGWWLWLSRETDARLDAAAADLRRAGWTLSWAERRVDGYPFRLNVRLTDARFLSAGGRGLSTPILEADAYAYRPNRWLLAFPEGLTIERPLVGPTKVNGRRLRASLGVGGATPRVSFEGADLTFTPAGGPVLFPLATAAKVEVHLRPHPDGLDEAGLLFRVTDARAAQGTLLQRIGGDPKAAFLLEGVIEKPSAFTGPSWTEAVRRWTDGGGRIRVLQGEASVGAASARSSGGALTVGTDGRLRGSLDLQLRRGPQALLTLGGAPKIDPLAAAAAAAVTQAREREAVAPVRLVFEAGVVTVGPVALAPAPKVY